VSIQVLHGDCTATIPGGKFHSMLCDPPYELGFMGKHWDASGIAFNPDTWRKIGEHLHPGAFIMAFASSRGWHRLACAIEDAGFVIHPTIFGWAFGSGFPKATRIDTQVDKAAGAEPVWEGYTDRHISKQKIQGSGHTFAPSSAHVDPSNGKTMARKPATPLARAWAGHRYGLQALKPAVEPIIVAQWPYQGKPVDCITKTGAGALNVDGGRIGTEQIVSNRWDDNAHPFGGGAGNTYTPHTAQGRWPANFLLLDDEAAAALDRQSGVTAQGHWTQKREIGGNGIYGGGGRTDLDEGRKIADAGGASRFYYRVQSQLDEADPIRYQAKASRRERDAGCEGLTERSKAIQYGDGLNSDTKIRTDKQAENGVDRGGCRNHHPTVKPIDLAKYLSTLLLPPAEYAPRRILVPFSGVGSEMIGAMLAGWDEVVGIEQDAEYVEIARRRIEHWSKRPQQEPLL
jgi:site-specific DNA-methyltransferase (adenine-specific)